MYVLWWGAFARHRYNGDAIGSLVCGCGCTTYVERYSIKLVLYVDTGDWRLLGLLNSEGFVISE
jgi:hypothetical protein